MGICKDCFIEKVLVHGFQCRECRQKYEKERSRKIREKKCPACGNIHNEMAKECSMKCKILNRHTVENSCWIWNKSLNDSGYGKIQENIYGKKRHLTAHRESYKEFVGNIPKGMCVCHTCDNRDCVNPDHLWLGTVKDNARDMIYKNRGGFQKLTIEQVSEIKKMIKEGIKSIEIGLKYNIPPHLIRFIKRKEHYEYI